MKLKLILVFIGLGFSSISQAETCSLSGAQLARHAFKSGLSFTFFATEGTSCRLSSHKAGGSAASSIQSGVCTFQLFLGKSLSKGWSFSDISYAGRGFQIVKAPVKGGDSLHVELLLKPSENGTANFLITNVKIEGGDCDDWKSAL